MTRHWIAVASAEHVRRGRKAGFMQVCQGRLGPLRRLEVGDRVVYYSPTVTFRGGDTLQAFTVLGTVRGEPYQVDMGAGFRPFRRDVGWQPATEAPIRPLLGELELTAARHWGARLRFGLFEISARDMERISEAMRCPPARRLPVKAA